MIEGVKFSSRSFEISLKLVQVMVMGKTEKRSACLIKRQQDQYVAPIEAKVVAPIVLAPIVANKVVEPIVANKVVEPIVANKVVEPIVANKVVAPIVAPIVITPIPKDIEEITIDYATVEKDTISLKNPNDVYYELYKKAREKAKQCRVAAIEAYLEAKQIKTKYMLFDEDDSDDDISDDDQSEEEIE